MTDKKKPVGFTHDKQVEHRRNWYRLHRDYEIPNTLIEFLGEPTELIQALSLPEPRVEWAGGGCDGSTIDVSLQIPKLKGKGERRITVKMGERSNYCSIAPEGEVEIISTYHSCPELEWKNITRLPKPCHHQISARIHLEKYLPYICEDYEEGVPGIFHIRPIYRQYNDSKFKIYNFILENSEVAINDYKEIFKGKDTSAKKREILYERFDSRIKNDFLGPMSHKELKIDNFL